jgi:hypothetical protein
VGFLAGHGRVRRFEHEILNVGKWFMISKIVSNFLKIKDEFFINGKIFSLIIILRRAKQKKNMKNIFRK